MKLSREEALLFEAACHDGENIFACELLNLFAAEGAAEVLVQLELAPIGVFIDLVGHLWYAVLHEARRQDEHWGEMLERAVG